MRREIRRTIALGVFSLVVALTIVPGVMWQAQAQDSKTQYPNLAALDQYLMERNTEITLARSAAPESSVCMTAWAVQFRGSQCEIVLPGTLLSAL